MRRIYQRITGLDMLGKDPETERMSMRQVLAPYRSKQGHGLRLLQALACTTTVRECESAIYPILAGEVARDARLTSSADCDLLDTAVRQWRGRGSAIDWLARDWATESANLIKSRANSLRSPSDQSRVIWSKVAR